MTIWTLVAKLKSYITKVKKKEWRKIIIWKRNRVHSSVFNTHTIKTLQNGSHRLPLYIGDANKQGIFLINQSSRWLLRAFHAFKHCTCSNKSGELFELGTWSNDGNDDTATVPMVPFLSRQECGNVHAWIQGKRSRLVRCVALLHSCAKYQMRTCNIIRTLAMQPTMMLMTATAPHFNISF